MEHGTIDGYTNHRCRCTACREAINTYQRARRQERRAAYFADKTCVKCGSSRNLVNHHRDARTKGANFNTVWGWSEPRREVELAKCDVLCKGCHSKLHNKKRIKPIVHGTLNAYIHRVCRCDECRGAWNAYQRDYGKRRRAENPKTPRPRAPQQHGTYYSYVRYKCRCNACREASTAYARERTKAVKMAPTL